MVMMTSSMTEAKRIMDSLSLEDKVDIMLTDCSTMKSRLEDTDRKLDKILEKIRRDA